MLTPDEVAKIKAWCLDHCTGSEYNLPLIATVEELREELALAQNALAQAH